MDAKERERFELKLKHAEQMATQFAEGSFERESWVKIADGYRALMNGGRSDMPKDKSSPTAPS